MSPQKWDMTPKNIGEGSLVLEGSQVSATISND